MKRYILFIIILFIASISFADDDEKDWRKTDFGSFKIERFWEDTTGDYNCTYVLVSYKNTTNKTFNDLVTIRATIYDEIDNMINSNTRSFFSFEYGLISPGFEGILKIPIECEKGKAHSVYVRIEKAH